MSGIVDVIQDRMDRALRGEQVGWKGPGFTYGNAPRNGCVGIPPSTEETIERAIKVNELRLERPLTDREKSVVREAVNNA